MLLRALGAREQVLAVVGVEEFAERLDAADDQQEIVLAAKREHGIDEVVTRALIAELDLQAIGEEGDQTKRYTKYTSIDRQAVLEIFDRIPLSLLTMRRASLSNVSASCARIRRFPTSHSHSFVS